jgi:hypothetical protein
MLPLAGNEQVIDVPVGKAGPHGRLLSLRVLLLPPGYLSIVIARPHSEEAGSSSFGNGEEVAGMLNGHGSSDMLGISRPDDVEDDEQLDWCTGTADFHGQGVYDGI